MTYSEQDLRAVFGALESDAPELAGTLAGVDRLRRRRTVRRRIAGMATVAAVTVALAAGSLALPSLGTDQPTTIRPASPPGEPLEYRFAVDDIPGATLEYLEISDERQNVQVNRPSGVPVQIEVYNRGVFSPTRNRYGQPADLPSTWEPVDIHGTPGYFHPELPGPGLLWRYAPDSWVVVRLTSAGEIDRAELLAIAGAIHFDRTTPFLLPIRVGYLPPDVRPTGGKTMRMEGNGIVNVDLTVPGNERMTVDLVVRSPTVPPSTGTHPGIVEVDLGKFTVIVMSRAMSNGVPREELEKIARSITAVGDWPGPAGWITAEEAFQPS